MGWIAGPDDNENDRFPVDTLVKELKETVGEIDSFCQDYHGQARKCCDGIRTCFATMEESFASVKLQAVGNQNMHKACRKLSTDLGATKSCTVSWISNCHRNVNADHLAKPFHDVLGDLRTALHGHCNALPPERTTQWATTTTTTTRKTPTTTKPTSTSTTSSSSAATETATTTTTSAATTTTTTTKPTTEVGETLTNTSQKTVTADIHTTGQSTPLHVSSTYDPGKPRPPTDSQPSSSSGTSVATSVTVTSTSRQTPHSNVSSNLLASTISTTPVLTTSSNNSDMARRQPDSGTDSTIIIIFPVVGGLLLLCAISLCIFILYKRRQSKNSGSGGSLETAGKPNLFKWLFPSQTNAESVNTETEIYAEIDEAFMEAVYRYDKEKPNVMRDRISSNSQFNICYESNFNDDAIIAARDTIVSKTNSTETSIVAMEPLSPLALIRKDDDAITSFQIDQSKTQKLQESQSNGTTFISGQKEFLTRRPGFTDIRSDSSGGEYVYIEATPNDVFEDEQIYAVPSFEESEYDTAEYGRNPQRDISQAPEQYYNSFHVYKNVGNASFDSNIPTVQQNVKEYRRSSSDIEIDNHLYENPDTLMEY
ncbi:uncharacterized protein LOC123530111 isoform X1 [Mercenaria mercenaria]|uniref:uncharacterized protein LOC123530111 isoform X1 n=1 Tax=Mercenaria mercenaria TaxID=6596 RepID=UPI00234F60A1|nr:uncharacterized protein LOC123530111 isoform X1 [Mercenaria mercenaria]